MNTETDIRTIAVPTDERLAELYTERAAAVRTQASRISDVHHAAGDRSRNRKGSRWGMTLEACLEVITAEGFKPRYGYVVEDLVAKLDESAGAIAAIDAKITETNSVWIDHGCWSRFFVVPGGHIHSSMECWTCNNGAEPTTFGWLPSLSGMTEADAVAEHGAILCTACFPTAPVEWTNKYELEEAAKLAAQCPGSKTFDYDRSTARLGYYSGNYAMCSHCGQRTTVTSANRLRSHKPAAS